MVFCIDWRIDPDSPKIIEVWVDKMFEFLKTPSIQTEETIALIEEVETELAILLDK